MYYHTLVYKNVSSLDRYRCINQGIIKRLDESTIEQTTYLLVYGNMINASSEMSQNFFSTVKFFQKNFTEIYAL